MDILDVLWSVVDWPSYKPEQMCVLADGGSLRYPPPTPSAMLCTETRRALKQSEPEPLGDLIQLKRSANLKLWMKVK